MEKVENHFLQTYQSRMGLVFDKFRHALSLDLINKRLLDLMRRDPLTNVSNRMAYEDKEKYLQSQINSCAETAFAIAMFDVNNLKLINDTYGHDAGDGYLIRACSTENNITMFTALDTVRVLLDVLEETTLTISTIDA